MRPAVFSLEYFVTIAEPQAYLAKLGVRFIDHPNHDGWIHGYCPDHFKFTGRKPSHPKWGLNIFTGRTHCWTENRSSDYLQVAANILGYDSVWRVKDEIKKDSPVSPLTLKFSPVFKKVEEKKPNEYMLAELRSIFAVKYRSKRCEEFFMKHEIRPETLDQFGVVECVGGYFNNRALIPIRDICDADVKGCVAINLTKEGEWIERFVNNIAKFEGGLKDERRKKLETWAFENYKKSLYAAGAPIKSHLHGMYEWKQKHKELKDEVYLVEGERDVMRLQQDGICALGTHGARFNAEQKMTLISQGVKSVIFAFDGDEPGRKAAEKACKRIKADFNNVTRMDLPEGTDPKDLNGKEFLQLLNTQKNCEEDIHAARKRLKERIENR